MTIPTTDEGEEKLDHSYITGGNVKTAAPRKTVCRFVKETNMLLTYDPAIAFLGVYPREQGHYLHIKPVRECS